MPTLEEWIEELQAAVRIDALEVGIAALNARIAAHATSPERLAAALSISPRLMCFLTLTPRLAYIPTARVWLSRENGKWRTRSNAQIAAMMRNVLAQEHGMSITQATANRVEKYARTLFARAELPGSVS